MDEPVVWADSITKLGPEFRRKVLVAGSHGGRYCGYLAALAGLRGVILNNAGVGKDGAGIGALHYLQALGVAAATVSHRSARIGDGQDMMTRGTLSHCNEVARSLGCVVRQPCSEAAEKMLGGEGFDGEPPPHEEARQDLQDAPIRVVGCDSASLVVDGDADAVIVTGSHGGSLAGRPGYGLAVQARGGVFNDAGVGVDMAGIQRLPILDSSDVPAVTVDAMSARIGDALSAWETGVVSHANFLAQKKDVVPGMTVLEFVDRLT